MRDIRELEEVWKRRIFISQGLKKYAKIWYNINMIPDYVKPFLWSYDTQRIDLERDKRRVILNVLNLGSKPATDWLFSQYPKEVIKKTVEEFGAKGELSPKSLNYWLLLLEIDVRSLSKSRI